MTDRPALSVVETLYTNNARDVAAQMRRVADWLEAEEFDVKSAVFILEPREGVAVVYAWGETDDVRTLGLMRVASYNVEYLYHKNRGDPDEPHSPIAS